jgi:hypothetical protein
MREFVHPKEKAAYTGVYAASVFYKASKWMPLQWKELSRP